MGGRRDITRRGFVKICASALTMLGTHPALPAGTSGALRRYNRVRLADAGGRSVRLADLEPGVSYVFHYPYVGTPCFLIKLAHSTVPRALLETEDGRPYEWPGGVGPKRSVVAFSAICAHRMSHPSPSVSFIGYRSDLARFLDADRRAVERAGVIYCCSEKSVYDPGAGARVLGGPAKQPLAAIDLSYDEEEDSLYATGTRGGELFEPFLDQFGFRLALDLRTERIRERVNDRATVLPLAEYSRSQVRC